MWEEVVYVDIKNYMPCNTFKYLEEMGKDNKNQFTKRENQSKHSQWIQEFNLILWLQSCVVTAVGNAVVIINSIVQEVA